MTLERNDPARGGATFQLGGENGYLDSRNGSNIQSITGAPLHLVGSPKVKVDNFGTHTNVTVADTPWGWGNLDRTFLHKPLHQKSTAAGRYADELRQRFANAAWDEQTRLDRHKGAYLQEKLGGER
jgi:hypothetical protein